MAKTKAVSDAITRAQNEFKGITLATTDALDFANWVNSTILTAARWDFMAKSGTSFGTTAGTQDYANVPADFLWMKSDGAWIQDDSSSLNRKYELDVKDSLIVSTSRAMPRAISVEQGTKFRLLPVPDLTRTGSGAWFIGFEYYKLPTRLTATGSTFEFDDVYFDSMFIDGFVARVADFVDDERAGQWLGQGPDGKFRGTGFYGKFAAQLNLAIASENRSSDEPVYAPTSSLYLG